jgi:hypothetical protein
MGASRIVGMIAGEQLPRICWGFQAGWRPRNGGRHAVLAGALLSVLRRVEHFVEHPHAFFFIEQVR